ncbi:hypothetical protein G0Q06_07190 [Puniceicoccales bacterium CK1056]|uniref:Sulphotransferase Stf0 domain-containing protein n=1 Tax=Oceanipulchritudo coccoides TaxID=2706888 RepID=A0A6B2M2C2_9BACT|nr:Stf0 family sulfotransferase [Oceanipulchritudo coccoides]NDV62227.1 hypothetical protein [Oceanipulchritudo coccoides]
MKSIIICATPRSGSYLLSDLLNQRGMPFAEEWLTQFHQESRKRAYGVKDSLDYISFLKLLTARERQAGLFSMKVMFPQFYQLTQLLGESKEVPGGTFMEKLCHIFPNPAFIRVSRENKVAQAISLHKARQTGQWVKRRGEELRPAINPVYSFLGILDAFEERRRSEKLWEEFFESHPADVFEMSYEELIADKEGMLERIFNWAGLKFSPVAKSEASSGFQPMRSSINDDWIKRFEQDLERSLDDTSAPSFEGPENISISDVGLERDYIVGERYSLDVTCQPDPGSEISPVGKNNGDGWLRVSGLLSGDGFESSFEQELQLAESGAFTAKGILPMPPKAGVYSLKLVLSRRHLQVDELFSSPGVEHEVKFRHPPAREAARKLLPETRDLDDSWQYVEWFGYFLDDKFPWVYHADHEWLFIKPEPNDDGALHILDAQLGWLEVYPDRYPELRSLKDGKRWLFLKRVEDKRLFRDLSEDRDMSFETNRPEHLEKLNPGND